MGRHTCWRESSPFEIALPTRAFQARALVDLVRFSGARARGVSAVKKTMLIMLLVLTIWGGAAAYEAIVALKAGMPGHSARAR